MKFLCNKQELQKGISIVIKATSGKLQKSIFECIHISAQVDKLVLDAFDTVTAIRTELYAQVSENGETAIPARVLQEMVAKLPDEEITFESAGETGVRISCRNSDVTLQEMDAEQFPEFPETEGIPVSMKQEELKKLIDGTAFAAYSGEDKPVLTGILFEAQQSELSMVATDGVLLAKCTLPYEGGAPMRALIPSRTLKEVSRILDQAEDEVELSVSGSACFLKTAHTTVYTRLLEGEYLNYERVIPKTHKTRVRILTKLLQKSLDMVSVLAKEDSYNLVRLNVNSNYLELCSNSEYGTAMDQIPIYMEGEILTMAFNAKYLLDVMKNIPDENIFLEFDSKMMPCVIRPVEGSRFLYLLVACNVRE